ncbi:16327_t:CDS:2, partial [Gigaspora rosea]
LFAGHNSVFGSSGNTILKSSQTCHLFKNNISLPERAGFLTHLEAH